MAVDAHIYLLQKKLLWDQKTTFLHFLYDNFIVIFTIMGCNK